jgi:hypothetical protein
MICESCGRRNHKGCKNVGTDTDTWCDCQHRESNYWQELEDSTGQVTYLNELPGMWEEADLIGGETDNLPDSSCYTEADGSCTSTENCMHNAK